MSEQSVVRQLQGGNSRVERARRQSRAHDRALREALGDEYEYFAALSRDELGEMIADEYFASFSEDPTLKDLAAVEAYVEWRCDPLLDLGRCARDFGINPKELSRLITDVPGYLNDRYTTERVEQSMAERAVSNVIYVDFVNKRRLPNF